jgi:formamidopyrimidine-DNA glycosylase
MGCFLSKSTRNSMPELPEVEVVRRGLMPYLTGSLVNSVEILHPRVVRRNFGDFTHQMRGAVLTHIGRRGKYMWWELDRPECAIIHLGMSGQFRIYEHQEKFVKSKEPGREPDLQHPHLRLRFQIVSPDGHPRWIHFLDQRTFGGMHISKMENDGFGESIPSEIKAIARDPFDPCFDPEGFVSRARRSQTAIKRLLLNQSVISGIGNIYADESLFRSGIHGDTASADIDEMSLRALVTNVTDVMNEALEQGGTSFDSLYVNVNGESGYFSRSLCVYGREGEPCDRCGTSIARKKFMNRSSFYCPKCQVSS